MPKYAVFGVKAGLMQLICTRVYAPPTRKSKMSVSATIFQKSSSRPLRKLWNVIGGCHGCNCSMHLPQFSAVDAKKVNTAYSHTVLSSTVLILHRSPKTNVSRATSGNFCVRPWLQCGMKSRYVSAQLQTSAHSAYLLNTVY